MIGRLTGVLLHKEPPALLLEVGGVGYELEAPMTTFYDLPETGQTVTLHTHLVVREDAHLLYGFSRLSQRGLFRALLKISGVGPRMALAVLSGMNEQEFARCISDNDVTQLTRVPGVGRKTAERLIVELRDKLGVDITTMPGGVDAPPASQDPVSEAVSALIALGYKPQEASRLVRNVDSTDRTTEDLIREALKRLAG